MIVIAMSFLHQLMAILLGPATAVFLRKTVGGGVVLTVYEPLLEIPLWKSYLTNVFVILIWVLFVIAVYGSLKYLRWLRREELALEQAQRNLAKVVQAPESDLASVKSLLLKNLPTESILAKRIEDLYWLSQRGSNLEHLTSADTLAARENDRTGFARSVASVLVLLGLCGAIYGLSNLVIQMGPELRNMQQLSKENAGRQSTSSAGAPQTTSLDSIQKSVNTLIETMANSLEQTRGAFAASLTGISCSILLLLLNWLVTKRQVHVLTEVEELTSAKLIPLFQPLPDTLELSGAANSLSVAAEYASSLTNGLDNIMEQAIQSLQIVFTSVRKLEQGATVIRDSQESMTQAQLQFLALANQFSGLTKEIEQHQAGSKADVSNLVAAVNGTNEYIKRVLDDSRKQHEKVLQQVEAVSKQSIFSSTETKKETHNLVAQDINELRTTVQTNQTELLQQIKDLLAAASNGQGSKELVEQLGHILTEERNTFAALFKESIEPQQAGLSQQMEGIVKRQEDLINKLTELTDALAAPNENARIVRILQGNTNDTIQDLAHQHRETSDAVRRLPAEVDRLISVVLKCGKAAAVGGVLLATLEAWRVSSWVALGVAIVGAISIPVFFGRLSSVNNESL